jgi:hypothetical protein
MDGRFGEIERDSLLNNRIESNRITALLYFPLCELIVVRCRGSRERKERGTVPVSSSREDLSSLGVDLINELSRIWDI